MPPAASPAAALGPGSKVYRPQSAESARPAKADRRRAPRQTLVARATVQAEDSGMGVGAGYVSNISMVGIGFHTRRPLEVGQKYHIRLEVGPMKWSTRLRVVSCNPHDTGTWDVGAEFVGNDLSIPLRQRRELAA